jgi:hypothetical protein
LSAADDIFPFTTLNEIGMAQLTRDDKFVSDKNNVVVLVMADNEPAGKLID